MLKKLLALAAVALMALGAAAPAWAVYDNPMDITYSFPGWDCHSGDATKLIRGPKGMKGNVRFATGLATTSFVGTSTPGKLQVGDGTTANKYLDMAMGAANAGTASGSLAYANDYTTGLVADNLSSLPFVNITADMATLTVTCKAPTGGSPAGVADYFIVIRWF